MWEYLLNVVAVLFGILLIWYVVHNVGTKKISEAQSIPWIISGFVTIILGIVPGIIKILSGFLGIWYPPTIIYIIGIALLVFITLHHAITISKLSNELNELAMIVSILRHDNEKMEKLINQMKEKDIKSSTGNASIDTDIGMIEAEKKVL
jgi:hypothetical protein